MNKYNKIMFGCTSFILNHLQTDFKYTLDKTILFGSGVKTHKNQ
ncbi:hypothetical protein HDE70_000712 [Pedobacter cryoconitis]|nr:hypothetical protein [Pedobacter cryoconitis]